VFALSANTPARSAGLREGDLILSVNHEPVEKLLDFRHTIEQTTPGTLLPIKVWRDGETVDYSVRVGTEIYKYQGVFAIGLFWKGPDLWPDPGFSLIAAGYDAPNASRIELGSVKSSYRKECAGGKYQPSEQDWAVWLGPLWLSKGKTILAQEIASAPDSSPAPQLAPGP